GGHGVANPGSASTGPEGTAIGNRAAARTLMGPCSAMPGPPSLAPSISPDDREAHAETSSRGAAALPCGVVSAVPRALCETGGGRAEAEHAVHRLLGFAHRPHAAHRY